jgi:hypothetical protein
MKEYSQMSIKNQNETTEETTTASSDNTEGLKLRIKRVRTHLATSVRTGSGLTTGSCCEGNSIVITGGGYPFSRSPKTCGG